MNVHFRIQSGLKLIDVCAHPCSFFFQLQLWIASPGGLTAAAPEKKEQDFFAEHTQVRWED